MIRSTYSFLIFVLLLGGTARAVEMSENWTLGYQAPLGGFFLKSKDDTFRLAIMGYGQATQKWYAAANYNNPNISDYPVAFGVRRARFNFDAYFYRNYDLRLELDAAPLTNVNSAPAATSGVGLVEARATIRILDDALKLRVGKFINPFSTEDYRSSRAYDVVERYMVLNAMMALPALDSQYGVMLMGTFFENRINYFLGITNGNSKANANFGENDANKEYLAKIIFNGGKTFSAGLAFDYDRESPQVLNLKDLAGSLFLSTTVAGNRFGLSPDLLLKLDAFSIRAEFMWINWSNLDPPTTLSGGFLQLGYFVTGDETGGFQPLVRSEIARVDTPLLGSGHQLTNLTLGYQWFFNGEFRHQLNLVTTVPDAGGDGAGAYGNGSATFAILSEFQFGF